MTDHPHDDLPPCTPPPGDLPRRDTALPVAIELADGDLAVEVAAHVESRLGWQVVRPSPHLPARLLLADAVDPTTPTVLVAWQTDAEQVRRALQAGALDVLAWPLDAERLASLSLSRTPRRPADHLLVVTGAAPAAGATTVALALGALSAWEGFQTVVATDLSGRRMAGVAAAGDQPVAGVTGLVVSGGTHGTGGGRRPQVLVADAGAGRRGHVLVAAPDRSLVEALERRPDTAAVVTVGQGALRRGEVRRLVEGRTHVALDTSFRVARAGMRGLVPVGLPGRYLRALRPLLPVPERAVAA